ncbi:MAG: hypothetical protein EON54_18405 [Alcaligenaceae bacterium]|nr:MAG: hypothetical protein EON54_18405 [Alcaligenaceae bacterium]
MSDDSFFPWFILCLYAATLLVVAFYGMQGSGIIRAVGWYYACGSLNGDCQLLTVVHLGEVKSMKSKPTAIWSGTHLIVRVDGREVGRVKVPN